jgi:hypothetical protein
VALTWAEEDSSSAWFVLAVPRCPFGFDLHRQDFPQRVVAKAAPFPFRSFSHQTPPHGIAMDLLQLLDEFKLVPNVAIVIALLPERSTLGVSMIGSFREGQLERVHWGGEVFVFRLGNEEMNVFGHHDVSVNANTETLPHVFKANNKKIESSGGAEFRPPLVAAECQKMTLTRRVQPIQSSCHGKTLYTSREVRRSDAQVSATKRREPGAPGLFPQLTQAPNLNW